MLCVVLDRIPPLKMRQNGGVSGFRVFKAISDFVFVDTSEMGSYFPFLFF